MLLLMPLPSTPPIINLLILFMMIIHHKPCIYCFCMLMALCACSCQVVYFSYLTGEVGNSATDDRPLDAIQQLWMILANYLNNNNSNNNNQLNRTQESWLSKILRDCVRPRHDGAGWCVVDISHWTSLAHWFEPRRL